MRFSREQRILLMLLPALLVTGFLFGSALLYVLGQSFGWQPLLGKTSLTVQPYRDLLLESRNANLFWPGLGLSLWVSLISTAVSAVLALLLALLIRRQLQHRGLITFLLQFNLPVPHIVAAVAALFLFSSSGILSRSLAQLTLIETGLQFPLLVRDSIGVGIILTYIWKETPFIAVILLAALIGLGTDYEDAARTMGANEWQVFVYVTLPLVKPALIAACTLVFTFTFGAYEVPAILGVRYPQTLPVLAMRIFQNPDLNARPQAMAMSMLMTVIAMGMVAVYLRWQTE